MRELRRSVACWGRKSRNAVIRYPPSVSPEGAEVRVKPGPQRVEGSPDGLEPADGAVGGYEVLRGRGMHRFRGDGVQPLAQLFVGAPRTDDLEIPQMEGDVVASDVVVTDPG